MNINPQADPTGFRQFAIIDLLGTIAVVAILMAILVESFESTNTTTNSKIALLVTTQTLAFVGGVLISVRHSKSVEAQAGIRIGIGQCRGYTWSFLWVWGVVLLLATASLLPALILRERFLVAAQSGFFLFFCGFHYAKCINRRIPHVVHFYKHGIVVESKFYPWADIELLEQETLSNLKSRVTLRYMTSITTVNVSEVLWSCVKAILPESPRSDDIVTSNLPGDEKGDGG